MNWMVCAYLLPGALTGHLTSVFTWYLYSHALHARHIFKHLKIWMNWIFITTYEAGTIIVPVWVMKKLRTREVNSFSPVARSGRAGTKIQTGCFSSNAAILGLSDLVVLWSLPACPPALQVSSHTLTPAGLLPSSPQPCALSESWILSACFLPSSRGQEWGAGSTPQSCSSSPARATRPWASPPVPTGVPRSQQHCQALSWKLTRGCQWRTRWNLLLCLPWWPPILTDPRV